MIELPSSRLPPEEDTAEGEANVTWRQEAQCTHSPNGAIFIASECRQILNISPDLVDLEPLATIGSGHVHLPFHFSARSVTSIATSFLPSTLRPVGTHVHCSTRA